MNTSFRHSASAFAAALAAAFLTACGGGAPPAAPTPEAAAGEAAATITAADMGRHIGVLAHDSMAGRDTPSPELEAAARYIAAEFRANGLEPLGDDGSFIRRFDWERTRLSAEGTRVGLADGEGFGQVGVDFFAVPGMQPTTQAKAYYVGVAGQASPPPPEARGTFVIYDHPGGELDQQWQAAMLAAIQPAMMSGAAGLIIGLAADFPMEMMGPLSESTAGQQAPLPIIGMSADAVRELVAAAGGDLEALREAGEPAPLGDAILEIATRVETSTITPPNVAGMIRGSDPELRDTYVVITAHFDHVGVGAADESGDSIFNGADDDASGTAGVLEAAEAFAALPTPPARSVIFLAVSGEEKGLLGSRAFVEDSPVPVEDIVANVNMDMIGRNAPDTLIGIGQEYTTLEGVVQQITSTRSDVGLNVILDPVPEENYFFRSDQLPFIQRGIPAVFLTTGDHEDYHKQSDEPATIDTDKAARVARLAFYVAYSIATDPVAPEWTEEGRRTVDQMLQSSPF